MNVVIDYGDQLFLKFGAELLATFFRDKEWTLLCFTGVTGEKWCHNRQLLFGNSDSALSLFLNRLLQFLHVRWYSLQQLKVTLAIFLRVEFVCGKGSMHNRKRRVVWSNRRQIPEIR